MPPSCTSGNKHDSSRRARRIHQLRSGAKDASVFHTKASALIRIVLSDTHDRRAIPLECMPTTTKGRQTWPTQPPGTPTISGARPPTASSQRAGPRRNIAGEPGLNLPRFRYHPHLSTNLGQIQIGIQPHSTIGSRYRRRPWNRSLSGPGRSKRASHGCVIPQASVSEILTQVKMKRLAEMNPTSLKANRKKLS